MGERVGEATEDGLCLNDTFVSSDIQILSVLPSFLHPGIVSTFSFEPTPRALSCLRASFPMVLVAFRMAFGVLVLLLTKLRV